MSAKNVYIHFQSIVWSSFHSWPSSLFAWACRRTPLYPCLTKSLTSQKPKNRASLTAGCDFWETLMWSSVNAPPEHTQKQQKFGLRDLCFFWGDLSAEDFSLGSLWQIIPLELSPEGHRSGLSPALYNNRCHMIQHVTDGADKIKGQV